MQKFEYLENEKSFLDEIKSIFQSVWRAIFWWKNKDLIKIASTNFKCPLLILILNFTMSTFGRPSGNYLNSNL